MRAAASRYPPWVDANDTPTHVQALQDAAWRRMTGAARLQLAFEMSALARSLSVARIRAEHPAWTERQVARELLRIAMLPEPLPEDLP